MAKRHIRTNRSEFEAGYAARMNGDAIPAPLPPAVVDTPLAAIRRHAESHRALAGSDAYSAQEAPRLEAALTAVEALIDAARLGRNALDSVGAHGGALNALDEALAKLGGGA